MEACGRRRAHGLLAPAARGTTSRPSQLLFARLTLPRSRAPAPPRELGHPPSTCLPLVCTGVGNEGERRLRCVRLENCNLSATCLHGCWKWVLSGCNDWSGSDQPAIKKSGRQVADKWKGASRWFGSWFGSSKDFMEVPKIFLCHLSGSSARVEKSARVATLRLQ